MATALEGSLTVDRTMLESSSAVSIHSQSGIQFVEGTEIEEDIVNLDGRRMTIHTPKGANLEFSQFSGAIPERIASMTLDTDVDAEEVDEEQIRGDGDDSDYAETVLELNECSTDEEVDNPEWSGYLEACERLDTIPVSRILEEVLSPKGTALTELDLSHHGTGNKGARAIAKALHGNATILKLNLSDNGIEASGGAAIARMLLQSSAVVDFDISENKLGHSTSHLGTFDLGNLLGEGKLQKANLSRNGLVDADMDHIINALKSTSVSHLDLSHNLIGEESGVSLGPAIGENMAITHLDLSWNQLRLAGAIAVAEGLGANSVLDYCDLASNGFADVGAAACAEMLKVNSTLSELNLTNNRIRTEGSKVLAEAMCSNSSLKVLKLAQNQLEDEGVQCWLETLLSNSDLETLDLNYVPHSAKVNGMVHDLIDRSEELDAEVKTLEMSQVELKKVTMAWEALQEAKKTVAECRKQHDAAVVAGKWDELGGLKARLHWSEGDLARLLGPDAYALWKRVVQVPLKADALLLKTGSHEIDARTACAHRIAANPDDRETPVTQAYEGFLLSTAGVRDGEFTANEVYFIASYAALSGVCGVPAALFKLWSMDTSPMAKDMQKTFQSSVLDQLTVTTPKIDITGTLQPGVKLPSFEPLSDDAAAELFKTTKPSTLDDATVAAANAAFVAAYGPAYAAATTTYAATRAKHPKDQQVALKAAKEVYMEHGGNAAFDPTLEIGELEAIRLAKDNYKKEMRLGKGSEGDTEGAASQATRAYKTVFGKKDNAIVAEVCDLYLDEKRYGSMVEKLSAMVEEEFSHQTVATKKTAEQEAASRKKEREANKRPDFDLKLDFGLRAGEEPQARRDPFELLHEFLDRHELRYYDLFTRLDASKNHFLVEEELKQGLIDVGFDVTAEQLNTVVKVFFPAEDKPPTPDPVDEDPNSFDEAKVNLPSITYHVFTHRLFSHEDDF